MDDYSAYLPEMENLLRLTAKFNASDLHMKSDAPPYLRISGAIRTLDMPPLSHEKTQGLLFSILSPKQRETLLKEGDVDMAYSVPEVGRFRVNIFRERGKWAAAIRRVNTNIPSFQELNLPAETMKKIASLTRGLVIVSGVTGSGKSTKLAAIIDYINSTRRCHIVTIEDPIEYLHEDKKAFINQREVGIDVESFSTALKYVVRQDPDVILIGELRDEESVEAGIAAAETGHLVLATLHSSTCAQTFSRLLEFFPAGRQDQIRQGLQFNLKAIISQRLLPCKKEGVKLVPAVEILIVTPIVRKLISEKEDEKITDVIRAGKEQGMQDFTYSLYDLVKRGFLEEEVALAHAPNPEALRMMLSGIMVDEGRIVGA